MSVEQRAARVALATGLSTVLSIVLQLVTVPVCLHFWGKETYGQWLALFAAFMLLRTLDTGFTAHQGNKLNLLFHQDEDALRKTLASSVMGVLVIGALQLGICLALTTSGQIAGLLGVSPAVAGEGQVGLALFVLVGTWVLSGPYLGIVHRLLIPTGMMQQATWWGMGYQGIQFVMLILAAALRASVLQASMLFALGQLAIYFGSAIYIRWKLPRYYPWWQGIQPREGLRDLVRSIALTLSTLVQQATVNGLVMLVAALSGPAVVPVFTTVRTLANLWTTLSNILATPLIPDVVRYHVKAEQVKLRSTLEAHGVLAGSAINLSILVAYPFVGLVYGTWTRHAIALDRPLLCALLASVAIANAALLANTYYNSINQLRVVFMVSLVRGGVIFALAALLLPRFELSGLGLAILLGELVALLLQGGFLQRELGRAGLSVLSGASWPVLVSLGILLAYLADQGSGRAFSLLPYALALASTGGAAYWGWRQLDPAVRARLMSLVGPLRARLGLR